MDYLKWLYSTHGIKLGLENITALMFKLGNPERKLHFIHVAGTNGKGSVTAISASILRAEGYRVGMYTSPHLVRYNERISIDGKEISDADLARLAESLYPYAVKLKCTYFEICTALAILYFLEQKCDFVCMEVGLGGRLDSTNIITPLVSIITTIGLEHTKHLGDTIEKIAIEKAGIIKSGVPIVTATEGVAFGVISKIAKEREAPLIRASPSDLPCNLLGDFQRINSGLAVEAMKVLRDRYQIPILETSIKSGLETVYWPGRLDFVAPNILVDVAHNPHGVAVLKPELIKLLSSGRFTRIILLTGILKDKDYKTILGEIAPLASEIILCEPKTERVTPAEELAESLGPEFQANDQECVHIIKDVKEAFIYARSMLKDGDLLVVMGSLYTAGEVYAALGR